MHLDDQEFSYEPQSVRIQLQSTVIGTAALQITDLVKALGRAANLPKHSRTLRHQPYL